MNIYALKGHKVRLVYTEMAYHYQTEDIKKHLKLGEIYTIEETEVYGEFTNVYLQEVPGVSFNSTAFEDVEPQPEGKDKQHPDYYQCRY